VHTLIVGPSGAEPSAAEAHQEEAAKKKLEEAAKKKLEEAAKKKLEEAAAAGSVILDGLTVDVENSREAAVKLTCSDVTACAGKLTLTASLTAGKGKARHARTESIGTVSFSIAAGAVAMVKIMLDSTGRALLSIAHGHLNAALTILRTSPLPNKTLSQHIHLDLKTAKAK
jgi:hypothetical protein